MHNIITFSRFSDIEINDDLKSTIYNFFDDNYASNQFPSLEIKCSLDLKDSCSETEHRVDINSVYHDDIAWMISLKDKDHNYAIRREQISLFYIYDALEEVMQLYTTFLTCDHEFEKVVHSTGNVFQDGRGICKHCEYRIKNAFEPKPHSRVARNDRYPEFGYPTLHNWIGENGKEFFVQSGDDGIVFGESDSYSTAFFEVFPIIDRYPTFIRGEGSDIKEAEVSAWKQYQEMLNCESHEFTREVYGTHHSDGYGICIHCNLRSSRALEPETLCSITGKPTTHQLNGVYICFEEYFKKDVLDAVNEKIMHINKNYEITNRNKNDTDTLKMDNYFHFKISQYFYNNLYKDEFLYNCNRSFLDSLIRELVRSYKINELNFKNTIKSLHLGKIDSFDKLDFMKINNAIDKYCKNETIVQYLNDNLNNNKIEYNLNYDDIYNIIK